MPELYVAIDEADAQALDDAPTLEVRVPASTSNLGAGFDCFGLALQLYVTVRATPLGEKAAKRCSVQATGEGSMSLASNESEDNLIFCAMRMAAEQSGLEASASAPGSPQ
ncbi:MAG: hypothetical protein WKF84_15235 [Pyrinomonadaceae bacterium]